MSHEDVFFTVDALLLRELGERLVGRPEVALAELIKNAYDADASVVEVGLADGVLTVADNGHGMSSEDFRDRWMRIGTNQKEREGYSRYRRRPLTGSKGVGRLAAQILGSSQNLWSISGDPASNLRGEHLPIHASIDWKQAQQQGDLIHASARLEIGSVAVPPLLPDDARVGTIVSVGSLANEWTARDIDAVAKRVWLLQPPMLHDGQREFTIRLTGEFAAYADAFKIRAEAFLASGWTARISGRLVEDRGQVCLHSFAPVESATDPGRFGWRALHLTGKEQTTKLDDSRVLELRVSTSYRGDEVMRRFRVRGSSVGSLDYDIRRFTRSGRQKGGVLVQDARDYLSEHGGVHVFDNGFELGYYDRERDWLGLTADIARRLGRLELLEDLLPDAPMGRAGLNLPTTRELYGEVRMSSAAVMQDSSANGEPSENRLLLQITRDRLLENKAYRELVALVRLGLEMYAHDVELAELARLEDALDDEEALPIETAHRELRRLAQELPPELRQRQIALVEGVEKRTRDERQISTRQVILVSALASAGMSALATFHDFAKNTRRLDIVRKVLQGGTSNEALESAISALDALEASLAQWKYFYAPFRDAEDRETEGRILVEQVVNRVLPIFTNPELSRGARLTSDIASDLTFPPGLYPAWHAVLQNALLNALAATLRTSSREIHIQGYSTNTRHRLEVLDTGIGVNLGIAKSYFRAWAQGPAVTEQSVALGLSGSGLGLFIVRTVCRTYGVNVQFVAAPGPYKTCLRFEWND